MKASADLKGGQMWEQLEADPDSGLLNAEAYMGCDRTMNNNIITMGYFTSTAKVQEFAHKEFHRTIWKVRWHGDTARSS